MLSTLRLPCLWPPSHDGRHQQATGNRGSRNMQTEQREIGEAPPRSVAGNVIRGSLGNLDRVVRLVRLRGVQHLLRKRLLPRGNPTAQLMNTAGIFAVGFLMRPLGGWLLGQGRGPIRAPSALTLSVAMMGVGSLGIALAAGLCADRRTGADPAGRRPAAAGALAGGRVRNLGDVSKRSRHSTPARLLLLIPVRDADQRPAAGAGCTDHLAAVAHTGADACLGLADRVRHRSGGRRDGHVAAAHDG